MAQPVNLRAELSIGRHVLDPARVPQVAELICARPRLAGRLLELLWEDDPGIANRAADVLERVSRKAAAGPGILADAKEALLGLLAEARFTKLRWNLALVIARLPLSVAEARRAAAVLVTYLEDRSSIVKTAALQGLADLTRRDASLLPGVMDLLRIQGRAGTPAMRARARLLLLRLDPPANSSRGQRAG
jgi:hypothetical protein